MLASETTSNPWMTIVTRFSIKEAVYKALYGGEQDKVHFRDLTVVDVRDPTQQWFTHASVTVKLPDLQLNIFAMYAVVNGLVLSLAWRRARAQLDGS